MPMITGGISVRAFSQKHIITPPSKLHFINHPRYGRVYPIVAFNFDQEYFKLPCIALTGLSFLNSIVSYAIFVDPLLFTPAVSSFIHNPLFVIPSFFTNYAMWKKYYINFFGKRSQV
jgi:hypothetical protein